MNNERFINELKKLNIILNLEKLNKLEEYFSLLETYNKKFNLTRIITIENVYLKHVLLID